MPRGHRPVRRPEPSLSRDALRRACLLTDIVVRELARSASRACFAFFLRESLLPLLAPLPSARRETALLLHALLARLLWLDALGPPAPGDPLDAWLGRLARDVWRRLCVAPDVHAHDAAHVLARRVRFCLGELEGWLAREWTALA